MKKCPAFQKFLKETFPGKSIDDIQLMFAPFFAFMNHSNKKDYKQC